MALEWQNLTKLVEGQKFLIEKVKIIDSGISIEGPFELPPLARLKMEDQIFVAAFVKSHGSIKQMEKLFGVSYPTIKSRLNDISMNFDFIDIDPEIGEEPQPTVDILDQLENGEIDIDEAVKKLKREQ